MRTHNTPGYKQNRWRRHKPWPGGAAELALACLIIAVAGACAAPGSTDSAAPAATVSRASDASLAVTPAGIRSNGLRSLSGGDGVTALTTRGGSRCLTMQGGTTPNSDYLYFARDTAPSAPLRPVYVTVSYFDDMPGGTVALEYDSATGDSLPARYRPAEDEAGGLRSGSGKWRVAIFRLAKPQFAHRQNLGADFRLSGGHLFVRSVQLSPIRPTNWDQASKVEIVDVRPLVHIGAGGQLIVGGFDPAHPSDAGPQSRALEAAVPALEALGVTSHEGYVRWNLCETAPGRYDWSVYDRFVAVYRRHHLKWVPFLIIGSAYSLPDWYYKKPGSQGYVCLEHHQECDVQSLWNPVLRQHVARFIRAFCQHYAPTGVIESILLGITGNYGEAIYPVTGNDWTADIHGPYHTHPGYWAGDPFAVASFRQWVSQRYGDPARLSAAWGRQYGSFNEVQPFLQQDAPNDRAWLDFMHWYIGSMTDWARFWLGETRRDFPHGNIYLCTGGDAPPQHGSDFDEQCKAAAAFGAGVRITNEGSDYQANFSLTRWVASAGRQYGAYFGFEPAGGVDPHGVVARIYNATASGARGLHYYFPNLFGSQEAEQAFVRWGSEFRQRRPVEQIAVYYPETFIQLHGNHFLGDVQRLRDRFDFDYKSDGQIADGGLQSVKALILLQGNVAEQSTWQKILQWVQAGGVLFYPDGIGRLRSVEGDESVQDALFGPAAKPGRGRVFTFHGDANTTEYRDYLSQQLAALPQLSPGARAMVAADGKDDGLFVSFCAPNELLWLNTTPTDVRKALPTPVLIPAYGIASQRLK